MNTDPVSASISNDPHCFWLGEFERNGYSDSDFYVIYYDANLDSIEYMEHGSTRYPGGVDISSLRSRKASGEMLEKALKCLENKYFDAIVEHDKEMVDTPILSAFTLQARMVLTEDARKKDKNTKKFFIIPAGTQVEVLGNPTSFGTFYAKGYNKPCRSNSSAPVRLLDGNGELIYIPCDKLKLIRPYVTEEKARELAVHLSKSCNWLNATDHGSDPRYMGWLSSGVKLELASAN